MVLSAKRLTAPPAFAVRAAVALRRQLLRAADAVIPAQIAVLQRVIASTEVNILSELARAGVPDLLEREALSADEIAARPSNDRTHCRYPTAGALTRPTRR